MSEKRIIFPVSERYEIHLDSMNWALAKKTEDADTFREFKYFPRLHQLLQVLQERLLLDLGEAEDVAETLANIKAIEIVLRASLESIFNEYRDLSYAEANRGIGA